MFCLFLSLFALMVLMGIGFLATGAVLNAAIWLFIRLPVAIVVFCAGLLLCCTIILIPIGIKVIGAAFALIMPF